jgi:aspartate ammonia-lyase
VPADAYIRLADDLIEATQDTQAFVLYSSCMKSLAIKLSRACNDLRLLSSGPCCGLHDINLPAKTDVQRLFQEY